MALIDAMNADEQDSAVYHATKFADMTPAEFKEEMLMSETVMRKTQSFKD